MGTQTQYLTRWTQEGLRAPSHPSAFLESLKQPPPSGLSRRDFPTFQSSNLSNKCPLWAATTLTPHCPSAVQASERHPSSAAPRSFSASLAHLPLRVPGAALPAEGAALCPGLHPCPQLPSPPWPQAPPETPRVFSSSPSFPPHCRLSGFLASPGKEPNCAPSGRARAESRRRAEPGGRAQQPETCPLLASHRFQLQRPKEPPPTPAPAAPTPARRRAG